MEDKTATDTVDSALMLFAPVNIDRGTNQINFVEYRPTNQLSQTGPVEFTIPPSPTQYTDLRRCRLKSKVRIVGLNGKVLEEKDIVAPVNFLAGSLYSQVDVYLQQRLMSSGSGNHPYRCMFDLLLNNGQGSLESVHQAGMFYKDSASAITQTDPTQAPVNVGLIERWKLAKNSKIMDLSSKIHADIFNLDRYLINNCELKLRLHQTRNEFRLVTPSPAAHYTVELVEVIFEACMVTVSPQILTAHDTALSRSMALYPYIKTELKAFAIPKGSFQFNVSDIFLGSIPNRVLIAFVSAEAYSGSYTANPYNFEHLNVNFLKLSIDGNSVPGKPYQPRFDDKNGDIYMDPYAALFSNLKREEEDSGLNITR